MTFPLLHGPMADPALLTVILGKTPVLADHPLPQHGLVFAPDKGLTQLIAGTGLTAKRLTAPTPDDLRRLQFYATTLGATAQPTTQPHDGHIHYSLPESALTLWDEALWQSTQAPLQIETAKDVMALIDQPTAAIAARRQPMMLSRAASRLRAQTAPAPVTTRGAHAPSDIDLLARRQTYAHYFAVEEYDLRHRRFDGSWTAPLNRAVFISGDAATVLPWDPVRDLVLVIEQFRPGPFARGALNPWLLEAVAGRVDPFETPEDCARREAQEEAGLALDKLVHIASYYPSPAAKSEMLHSYVALCALPDSTPRQGGLAAEGEDIRSHLLPFARLMELIQTAEVANAPLILSAQWLATRREALRKS